MCEMYNISINIVNNKRHNLAATIIGRWAPAYTCPSLERQNG